jgi:acyl-CoA thioesterase
LKNSNAIQRALAARVERAGFAAKLGMRVVSVEPGHAVMDMIPQKEDTNIFDTVHGGAIFSLMDEVFQLSCNSHGTVAVALSVNVVYHRPARPCVKLRAESREVHLTRKTATYEIRVTDEEDALIATCQALAFRKNDKLPFLDDDSKE